MSSSTKKGDNNINALIKAQKKVRLNLQAEAEGETPRASEKKVIIEPGQVLNNNAIKLNMTRKL